MVNLEEIRAHLKDELTAAKHEPGKYICPICSSGAHGSRSTAAFSIMADGIHGHCFSCNFHGDIFDLVAARDGISTAEATKALIAKYKPGELSPLESARRDFSPSYRAEEPAAAPAAAGRDFAEYVASAHKALPGSEGERYLLGRGFTPETLERFKLGFDPAHYFPGRGTFPAVVFPYDPEGHYCGWRAITEKHFDKPKSEGPEGAGPEPVFNAGALYSGGPVFVVESQLDAITLEQVGARAVAIGGTAGKNKLLRQLEKKAPAGPLILCLDYYDKEKGQPDKAGREITAEIGAALEEKKLFCVDGAAAIMGPDCKDPNEVLTSKGSAALREAAGEVMDETRYQYLNQLEIEEAARAKRTGPGMIDAFLEEVQTRKYEPIPTGIQDIDKALDGGFMRQQLITLGAAPGAGKTALAQWMLEGMASRGISCIFLNLEMSRNQIIARSLSRYAARNGHRISNVKALRGYSWTPEERAAILEAAEEYKRTVAPFMIYNPEETTTNLDSILEYIEAEAQRAEAQGKAAPFVCLDYLQILTGKEREDSTELIKRAVFGLKMYAVKHEAVVLLIMAHNRKSNESGAVTMESGRDTSAIEYSGDTQIGLTFTRCLPGWIDEHGAKQKKGKSPDDLTEEERREITLKIVKGRFGGTGRRVDLRFDGETMTYTQLFKDFTVVDEATPFDDDEPQDKI